MLSTIRRRRQVSQDGGPSVEPLADYGFFGPDSVTWKVWGHVTAAIIGFQRSVVVEELDPALLAAVDATGANYERPRTRYNRTMRYFTLVAIGDSESVIEASDVLVKVHSKAIGTEPLSGNKYDANDPHSQLWIHLTAWHSILKVYERYGGGKLTPEEEDRYWQECAIAAEFQTCDPADVPRSRDEVHAYFDRMRPHLAVSEAALRMMDHLLNAKAALPPVPLILKPGVAVFNWLVRAGTIATLPRWMRRLSGFDQARIVDVCIRPVLRLGFGLVNRNPRLKLTVMGATAPSIVPIVAPYIFGVRPRSTEILTPAEARRRYGYGKPADAHLALRAKQHHRVFDEHKRASDDELIESQPYLGNLA